MIKTAKMLLQFLDGRARRRMVLLLAIMGLTALLEMASIGLVLPVLAAVSGPGQAAPIVNRLTGLVPEVPGIPAFAVATMLFAALFVVKNLVLAAVLRVTSRVIFQEQYRFAQKAFSLYLARPFPYHLRTHSAYHLQGVLRDAPHAFDTVRLVMNIVLEVLLGLAALVLLVLVDPLTSLAGIAVLAAAVFLYYAAVARFVKRWGARSHELEHAMTKLATGVFQDIRSIKLFACADHFESRFVTLTNQFARYLGLAFAAQQWPRLYVETVVMLGVLAAALSISARQGTADMVSFIGLMGVAGLRLMPSANRVLGYVTELRHRGRYIENVHRDLMAGLADVGAVAADAGSPPLPSLERDLRLEGIRFTYEGVDRPALEGIDLTIRKGEIIGIVGSSGAGKSTLVDVLLGLLAPQTGRITVDGRDTAGNLRSWQSRVGYVPQQIVLADDTLRRNVAFGIEDGAIDEAGLKSALVQAQLDALVAGLPEGLETMLGERGARLSGGERQRIGIARALYRDPEILVLDEATSALDSETEHEIAAAMERLRGAKTLILIAHRLSTVRRCDRMVFLKDGRIAATGTFAELKERVPEFQRMVELSDLGAG